MLSNQNPEVQQLITFAGVYGIPDPFAIDEQSKAYYVNYYGTARVNISSMVEGPTLSEKYSNVEFQNKVKDVIEKAKNALLDEQDEEILKQFLILLNAYPGNYQEHDGKLYYHREINGIRQLVKTKNFVGITNDSIDAVFQFMKGNIENHQKEIKGLFTNMKNFATNVQLSPEIIDKAIERNPVEMQRIYYRTKFFEQAKVIHVEVVQKAQEEMQRKHKEEMERQQKEREEAQNQDNMLALRTKLNADDFNKFNDKGKIARDLETLRQSVLALSTTKGDRDPQVLAFAGLYNQILQDLKGINLGKDAKFNLKYTTYPTVISSFTKLAKRAGDTKKPITVEDMTAFGKELDRDIKNLIPMSVKKKALICAVIGATVGGILGFVVGAAVTFWGGSFGALPTAIAFGIAGATLAQGLFIGGVAAGGAVVAGATFAGAGAYFSKNKNALFTETNTKAKGRYGSLERQVEKIANVFPRKI